MLIKRFLITVSIVLVFHPSGTAQFRDVSIQYGTGYSGVRLVKSEHALADQFYDVAKLGSQGKLSHQADVHIAFSLNRRFSLLSGLSLANYAEGVNHLELRMSNIEPRRGYVTPTNVPVPVFLTTRYNYFYVDIPWNCNAISSPGRNGTCRLFGV